MLIDNIQKQIGEAMKARDGVRLSTLRMLSSALNYEKIAKQHELTQEEELVVVKREAKKRNDAIEAYSQIKTERSEELKKKEEEELSILKEYLPEEMADDELEKLIDSAIEATGAVGLPDIGKVIGHVMGQAKGRADGSKTAKMAKNKLS